MYYTYILYSESADRYYVGSTGNLEKRLEKHNFGNTVSTRPYRPWKLVYFEEYETKSAALRRESEIKMKKSRKYLTSLIEATG
jgi:putative endonuclease